MSEHLAWALGRARDHTLALIADVPADRIHHQSAPDERHPATIGHHLVSLVFQEGYHVGQLASCRKAHGFAAVAWTFGLPDRVQTDLRPVKQTK